MWDKELALELVDWIIENIEIILKRSVSIKHADDFSATDYGMILLDSNCMKLAAIGESIKNLDKISNGELLPGYSQIPWKQVMGMRDIIVHHYFDIDAEVIYKTLREDIPELLKTLITIQQDLS